MDASVFSPTEARERDRAGTGGFDALAEARKLFETRKDNYARREPVLAAAMRFAGREKAFCIASVTEAHRYQLACAQAEAATAAELAKLTPEQVARRIDAIDAEIERLPYASLKVDVGAKKTALLSERNRLQTLNAERTVQ